MTYFAVIDTETNWQDQVMSIGTVIADSNTFCPVDAQYHVLDPEYLVGGMYSDRLFPDNRLHPVLCTRREAVEYLCNWLTDFGVTAIFAYNASFDRNHLPEFSHFCWYDIIRIAAYRQHNPKIPHNADCCSTGRMKRNYGVESMTRLLSGDSRYHETHNAIYDAMDELTIMRLLGQKIEDYIPL